MPNKTEIKIAFTFIGTLIGAGFASGREIALFFASYGLWSPVLAAVLCAVLSYVFLELGRLSDGAMLNDLFPKTANAWQFVISLSNFAVFAAMIAGAEYLLKNAFGFTGGGLLSGLISLAFVLGGTEKIKSLNFAAVPLIIVLVTVLSFSEGNINAAGGAGLISPLLYAAMNILSGGFMVSGLARGLNKKNTLKISVIIAVILTAVMSLIYLAVKDAANAEMPLLDVAKKHGLYYAGIALIYAAMITTMVAAHSISCGKKKTGVKASVILAAAYLVAAFGFARIVNYSYPVIGIAGAVLSVFSIIKLILYKFPAIKKKFYLITAVPIKGRR